MPSSADHEFASGQGLSSGLPAARKLWHLSKTHRFELLKQGFWRQPATLAGL
jgi:hypothetical protein